MTSACVIVNYNDSKRIVELCNLLKSYKFFSYIVVVDNNSKVEERLELTTNLNDVSVVLNNENCGFSGANNIGFNWLKDKGIDLVFTINSDVYVEKEVLIDLSNFLMNNVDYSIVSCQMLEYGVEKQCFYDFPSISKAVLENIGFIKLFKIKPKHFVDLKNGYLKVDYIRSSLWCCRFDDIIKIAGFDENTFLYHVETCVGLKLRDLGKSFAISTKLHYDHNHIYKKGYKIRGYCDSYKSLLYIFKNYYKKHACSIFIFKLSYYFGLGLRKLLRIK